MSWSQSILVHTITSSSPWQSLVESPEHTGNAEGSWGTSWGHPCASWGHPCYPHSSALTPCLSSRAQLCFTSPRKLGREKTGSRCCVNLCSINFDSDFHPSEAAQQSEHGGCGSEELLCSALLSVSLWGCTPFQPPVPAAVQCPGCHSTFTRLIPGCRKLRGAALIAPAKPSTFLAPEEQKGGIHPIFLAPEMEKCGVHPKFQAPEEHNHGIHTSAWPLSVLST